MTALFSNGFKVLTSGLSVWVPFGSGITQLSLGYSTALVGAGYLIGIAGGLALLAGIILAWGVMIPYFTMTGTPADGQTLQKFAQVCYVGKVRLIGTGVMSVAAIWTLIKLARPVIDGVKEAIQSARASQEKLKQHRTDRDMSAREMAIIFAVMFVGLLGAFYSLVSADNLLFAQSMIISLVSVLLAITISFFVAAAAYMAGLVGTSSSPISGIGILAIIISSLVIMTLKRR